ncbi:hypothetical protein VNO78_18717 [Psophocarpus tetragonolobus]|uniref:BHLH domain-containing protein n=1 Tax=Psophocarpus tetragonolobus TaxID=3891 RepID=A0AAN9SB64_PSOTE
MYPSSSSSSSSSSQSMSQAGAGLTRYVSAPGSLLTSTVDAVIGGSRPYYSGDSTSKDRTTYQNQALVRQKSSPAGFLAVPHSHPHTNEAAGPGTGFTITRGVGGHSRLKSQLSFTGHCGENSNSNSNSNSNNGNGNGNVVVGDPMGMNMGMSMGMGMGMGMEGWDNSIAFSAAPTKRSKNSNDPDIVHCLNALESQFSLPHEIDKLLHIPQDSVPCKIRAKRGCATHPRSIAERERRTRISGKLKKLQDLVPNMDKQTSYADMLDLAVQHIKGLQTQVQKLHKELENCTCGCKQGK